MSFKIDNQTISDIELFPKHGESPSLFEFYDRTKTTGGHNYLYKILKNPFSDRKFLEQRKAEIEFFVGLDFRLTLSKRQFDFIEYYLRSNHIPLKNNHIDILKDKLFNKLKSSNDHYVIREGIFHLGSALRDLKEFCTLTREIKVPYSMANSFDTALSYLEDKRIRHFLNNLPDEAKGLKQSQINAVDNLFRDRLKKHDIRFVLDFIYKIDVFQSHCEVLQEDNFSLPEYEKHDTALEVVDCVHPLLPVSVPNSFKQDHHSTLVFLTGPNMSGKSTFLKTIGILTYFAHLGMPVPAKRLQIPVFNGLFTTINLSDSISQGFSHFYSEVNRLKEMSSALHNDKRLVVILDELFRGTNVKDAQEGTHLIIDLLARLKGSVFFISTHILEVAERLAGSDKIKFICFESGLNNGNPVYNYKLKHGISKERVGMQIIENAGIVKMLSDIIKVQ